MQVNTVRPYGDVWDFLVGATLGNPQSSFHSLRGTPILVARLTGGALWVRASPFLPKRSKRFHVLHNLVSIFNKFAVFFKNNACNFE